jgi:hypothetical protein
VLPSLLGRPALARAGLSVLVVLVLVGAGLGLTERSHAAAHWAVPLAAPSASPGVSPSPSPTASRAPRGDPTDVEVPFTASVEALPADFAAGMVGKSWHPGCPVPQSALRLLHLTYWGFDNAAHQGEMVTNADVSQKVVRIFGKLYAARFPIRKMVPVDAYGGSDDASMADDNTSGFNCRNAFGNSNWSRHAFGRAVDVNTIENPYKPYADKPQIVPPQGAPFMTRGDVRPGMIEDGDPVVQAFTAEGFIWGGARKTGKDYQHFEM